MADNLEKIVQDIETNLSVSIKGLKDALKGLEGLSKNTSEATKEQKKFNKEAAKSTKIFRVVQRGWVTLGKIMKGTLGTSSAAAGIFTGAIRQVGYSMSDFELSVVPATEGLKGLREAFRDQTEAADLSTISINNAADALLNYMSKGVPETIVASNKEFQKGFAGLTDLLAGVWGKDKASQLVSDFASNLDFRVVRKVMGKEIAPLVRTWVEAKNAMDKEGEVKALQNLIDKSKDLSGSSTDLLAWMKTVRGLEVELKTLQGEGDRTASITFAIREALGKLGSIMDYVADRMLDLFGPKVTGWIKETTTYINTNAKQAVDNLHDRIQAWLREHEEGFRKAIDSVKSIIKFIKDLTLFMFEHKKTVLGVFAAYKLLQFTKWAVGAEALRAGLFSVGKAAGRASVSLLAMAAANPVVTALGVAIAVLGVQIYRLNKEWKENAKWAKEAEEGLRRNIASSKELYDAGTKRRKESPDRLGELKGYRTQLSSMISETDAKLSQARSKWFNQKEVKKLENELKLLKTQYANVAGEIEDIQPYEEWRKSNQVTAEHVKNVEAVRKWYEKAKETIAKFFGKHQAESKQSREALDEQRKIVEAWTVSLGQASSTLSGMNTLIQTLGPDAQLAGKAIGEAFDGAYDRVSEHVKRTREEAESLYRGALRNFNDDSNKTLEERRKDIEQMAAAMEGMEGAMRAQQQAIKLVGASDRERAAYAELNVSAAQAELDIRKALYGGAALAVENQLEVVKGIEKEKKALTAVHKALQAKLQDENLSAEERYLLQKEELEIRTKISQKTAEQLRMVKELRDGYLDAVQAMSFGAGRFSKLVLTQEKNVAIALEQGMAMKNFLLGGTGKRAAGGPLPIRPSGSKFGFENLDGSGVNVRKRAAAMAERVPESQRALSALVTSFESLPHKISGELAKTIAQFVPRGEAMESHVGHLLDQKGRAVPGGKPRVKTPTKPKMAPSTVKGNPADGSFAKWVNMLIQGAHGMQKEWELNNAKERVNRNSQSSSNTGPE